MNPVYPYELSDTLTFILVNVLAPAVEWEKKIRKL